MKKLLHLIFIFLFFLFSFFFSLTPCHAISDFTTNYFIIYKIFENGETQVTQEVKLKNKLKNVYATEYSLNIGSTKITNIQAWDNKENLNVKVENLENSTQITVFLKQKVLGKDEEQNFFLSYKTPDFAFVKGRVLEIGIPLLSQLEEVETYNVNLYVPLKFGEATSILPPASSVVQKENQHIYSFSKEVLKSSQGITATFGQTQIFKFTLKYHLENPGAVSVETQITLPPDTAFQKISYESLEPQPENVEIDEDGNFLATYILGRQEKKDISAKGFAQIFLIPKENFPQETKLSESDYLSEQKFWEVGDPEIKKLAERLKTPRAIYDYLVKNFIYDYGRAGSGKVERLGAKNALKNPANSICMEFTDSFVALARAAGIKAREVNGFAYTANPKLRPLSTVHDVLHAWPQYWDEEKKLWISIDPTWGNTTGGLDFFEKRDLDHFAFIFHGLSSENPLPPGSFKLENSQEKDINIEFADEFPENLKSEVELNIPPKIIAGTTNSANVIIKNIGSNTLYYKTIDFSLEEEGKALWQKKEEITMLPPFSKIESQLKFSLPFFIRKTNLNLTVQFDNQKTQKQIKAEPLINFELASLLEGTVLGLLLTFIFLKIGYFVVKRVKRSKKSKRS